MHRVALVAWLSYDIRQPVDKVKREKSQWKQFSRQFVDVAGFVSPLRVSNKSFLSHLPKITTVMCHYVNLK